MDFFTETLALTSNFRDHNQTLDVPGTGSNSALGAVVVVAVAVAGRGIQDSKI